MAVTICNVASSSSSGELGSKDQLAGYLQGSGGSSKEGLGCVASQESRMPESAL